MPESLLTIEIRKDILRQRFTTSIVNDDIKAAAQAISRSIPNLLAGFDSGNMTRQELNSLISDVKKAFVADWGTMWGDINPQLLEVALIEGKQITDLYDDYADEVFSAPTAKAIETASRTTVMTLTGSTSTSGTWSQFMAKNTGSTAALIDAKIREGFSADLTLSEMTQQLRGKYNRKTKKYIGGIINGVATSRAEALVRTGTAHYSSVARDKFVDANRDVIESRILFVTLDNRTTTICLGRSGNVYKIGENYPHLPFHYGERSIYLFKTASFDPRNATRPITKGRKSKEAKEAYNKRKKRQDALRDSRAEKRAEGIATPETKSQVTYKGRKDSDIFDIELVKGNITADAFMRNNPVWFQNSALGVKRAELFRGGVSIDKFSDLTGRRLTLKELAEAGYQ